MTEKEVVNIQEEIEVFGYINEENIFRCGVVACQGGYCCANDDCAANGVMRF